MRTCWNSKTKQIYQDRDAVRSSNSTESWTHTQTSFFRLGAVELAWHVQKCQWKSHISLKMSGKKAGRWPKQQRETHKYWETRTRPHLKHFSTSRRCSKTQQQVARCGLWASLLIPVCRLNHVETTKMHTNFKSNIKNNSVIVLHETCYLLTPEGHTVMPSVVGEQSQQECSARSQCSVFWLAGLASAKSLCVRGWRQDLKTCTDSLGMCVCVCVVCFGLYLALLW